MKTISSTIATEILNILCCFFPNCFTVISLDINLFRVLGLPSLLHTIGFPHVALIHFSHLIFPGTVLPCTWFLNHLEPRPTVCADQAPHLGIISSWFFYFFPILIRGILGPFVNRVRPLALWVNLPFLPSNIECVHRVTPSSHGLWYLTELICFKVWLSLDSGTTIFTYTKFPSLFLVHKHLFSRSTNPVVYFYVIGTFYQLFYMFGVGRLIKLSFDLQLLTRCIFT